MRSLLLIPVLLAWSGFVDRTIAQTSLAPAVSGERVRAGAVDAGQVAAANANRADSSPAVPLPPAATAWPVPTPMPPESVAPDNAGTIIRGAPAAARRRLASRSSPRDPPVGMAPTALSPSGAPIPRAAAAAVLTPRFGKPAAPTQSPVQPGHHRRPISGLLPALSDEASPGADFLRIRPRRARLRA